MFDEFVPFEIAKKLKDKGFKEPCFAYYVPSGSGLIFNKTPFRNCIVEDCLYSVNSLPIDCIGADFIDSPTISQVLKWLREEKNIHIVKEIINDDGYMYASTCGKRIVYDLDGDVISILKSPHARIATQNERECIFNMLANEGLKWNLNNNKLTAIN